RLVASLGDYIYAKTDDAIYVNLFVGSNTTIPLKNGNVDVRMETNYPWDGKVKLMIDPVKKGKFKVYIRVPGWYDEFATPGGLYDSRIDRGDGVLDRFDDLKLKVNGKEQTFKIE